MCGIFGYVGCETDAPAKVVSGLKSLEYRGYDSWGVAYVPVTPASDKKLKTPISIHKRTGKIGSAVLPDSARSDISFGHTRWATHGGVTELNAHPHLDCTGKIALIHNGIIENYQELKDKLIKKDHKFRSETDTEVAVHLIEEHAKTMLMSKAVQKAFNEMTGLNAFIVMSEEEHRMIAVRNGSPLVVGFGTDENFIASDAMALIPYTKQVHFLEDNQMAIVSENGIMIFNARTGEGITPRKQMLTWSIEETVKGKYDYFMLKEIHEQPAILSDIAANYEKQEERIADRIQSSKGTYLVGCGTAAYACMTGAYLFSKIAGEHMNWAIGSEFSYQLDFLTKDSLIIALSQSGETMDTLEAIRRSKEKGAKIFALVNTVGSTLFREADYRLLIGAGPEKGVASTKAFTGKMAHLILLAYTMAGKTDEGKEVLVKAIRSAKKILKPRSVENIRKLAKRICSVEHIYVIGRGMSYPAALEAALKIKEISYIHAEGLPAGELKHGPLALVEKGTPCIAFMPDDETYGSTLAGAMEMKARGGLIIGVSHKPHRIFDIYIPVMDAREGTIIPNVIFGQLLAYYLTLEKGYDPDKPRNLAKSVTVK